jgi:hypothetical protein
MTTAVIINPIGTYQSGTFKIEIDDNGKVLKMEKTSMVVFKECPICKHKNKVYNNFCVMCRWDLSKDSKDKISVKN